MCYMFIHHSQVTQSLGPFGLVYIMRLLSTRRLPVASYKNNFSMTEWRIRLGGSGQSSGTPFTDLCPAPFWPFIRAS